MKRLFDTLTIWLILSIRHGLRYAVVLLCLGVFVTGGYFNGGGWVGAAIGLFFGIIFAFGDELADEMEK